MKFKLNPYALVIESEGTLNFILSDHSNPIKLAPNEKQSQMMGILYSGEFVEYEKLVSMFGQSFVDGLVESGCLVPREIDTKSMFSRTDAFFLTHNMPYARARLSQKKVIILGCGGIGTHMAWHFATIGVSEITIVDFDAVEQSNLNRQLLFDRNDIGKEKVQVIKEKLHAINEGVTVNTVSLRISSPEELEAVCTAKKYDLIVKALDSPAQFPLWLEMVAKKHGIPYISGITMRDTVLVGPTYIPHKSRYGWNEIMNFEQGGSTKVFGTAPSLGIMLYHISSELAIEAFKILSGYGEIKYKDKILCKNLFTGDEHCFQKEDIKKDKSKSDGKELILSLLLVTGLSVCGIFHPLVFILALAAAIILPGYIYADRSDVMKNTFLNASVLAVSIVVMMINLLDTNSAASLISSLVLLFGTHSAVTLFVCGANFFLSKFVSRRKMYDS